MKSLGSMKIMKRFKTVNRRNSWFWGEAAESSWLSMDEPYTEVLDLENGTPPCCTVV